MELQQESILNSEKEQQAIGDLVKQGYQALIDSLSESVSKYKELLQNAKNAHDYQKNISQQTENISTLKKQINAYASMTDNEEVSARACLKIAFCQMCFSLCGRFMPKEEGIAGYAD